MLKLDDESTLNNSGAWQEQTYKKTSFHIILLHNSDQCENCRSNQERYKASKFNVKEEPPLLKKDIQNGRFNVLGVMVVTPKVERHKESRRDPSIKTSHNKDKKPNKRSCQRIKTPSKRTKSNRNSRDSKNKIHTSTPKHISKEHKIPGKGTLKRKRWMMRKLENSQEYEDDIYEGQELYSFEKSYEDINENTCNMDTPKWAICLSPRDSCDTPVYEDCISQEELIETRKMAEEYQHRRTKRRKMMMSSESETYKPEEIKQKLSVTMTLEQAAKKIESFSKSSEELSESSDEELGCID